MLATLRDVLPKALAKQQAVGLFNTVTPQMARAVISAAEALESPVIIGTAEVLLPYAPLDELASFLVPMAKKASIPVVLHFDHGLTEAATKQALELGFTSVMYDCSSLPYDLNLEKVARMADYVHSLGASIEGEIGHIGANDGSVESSGEEASYTNVDEAEAFARQTGVDALAIAFGTAHGAYKTKPVLNIDIIRAVRQRINTPLVMHGGSGLSREEMTQCITSGIAKVNIFTDLDNACAKAASAHYSSGTGFTGLMAFMHSAMHEVVTEKIQVFTGHTGA